MNIKELINQNKSFYNEIQDLNKKKDQARNVANNVYDSIPSQGFIPKEYELVYFDYKPTSLIAAIQSYNTTRHLIFPIVDKNGVLTEIDLDDYTNNHIYIEIGENILAEYPEISDGLLNSKVNEYLENKLSAALINITNEINISGSETEPDVSSTDITDDILKSRISEAIQTLNNEYKRNVSIIVPFHILPLLSNDITSKYNVYTANVEDIYVGDLKQIVMSYYFTNVAIDKQVKSGICTIGVQATNINCKVLNDKAVCKIDL